MNLIDFFKSTTEEVIIIVNKETIDSFFDGIDFPKTKYGVWKKPKKNNVRSIFRDGVTIHFVDIEDLDDLKLKNIYERN